MIANKVLLLKESKTIWNYTYLNNLSEIKLILWEYIVHFLTSSWPMTKENKFTWEKKAARQWKISISLGFHNSSMITNASKLGLFWMTTKWNTFVLKALKPLINKNLSNF